MALFETLHKDNGDMDGYPEPEDLFECYKCKIMFSLRIDKIIGKKVYCPLCKTRVKAKRWPPSP